MVIAIPVAKNVKNIKYPRSKDTMPSKIYWYLFSIGPFV
jgi:hypothetical protein